MHACRCEMACTVTEMLTLRTRLAHLNGRRGPGPSRRPSHGQGIALKSSREKKRQLDHAVATIETFGGPFPSQQVVEQKFQSIRDVRELFQSMDHAGNGYIDFTEFNGCLEALGILPSLGTDRNLAAPKGLSNTPLRQQR